MKKIAHKTPKKPYSVRIQKLRDELARRELDGYLVQERMDQYWLTGFTGEDGAVLLTQRAVLLLTDGRFDEAADKEAPYARKVLRKKRTPDETAQEFKRCKIARVGFNPDQMSVSVHKALKKHSAPAKLVATDDPITPLRAQKDAGEVNRMRESIRVAERAFMKLLRWVKPGLTERAIAARLVYEMQKLGAQGETFPSIVASGPNSSIPHAMPSDRKLGENDLLLIDWGAHVNWYGSDLTRVVWLGSIPAQIRKIFDVVREAHDRAIEAVRPGITGHDLDSVARKIIQKADYGKLFNHALGHGLGLVAHEVPRIGKGSQIVLEPGMVITIEPGIYLPGVGGVRLEDDVLVTKTGYEVLSSLPVEFS
ncbi:MAG: aminopeptidase P family protein [Phycisphaerae bacterium]|nr:aminopeptidase P family protein [Phycisphaerae bacterium]